MRNLLATCALLALAATVWLLYLAATTPPNAVIAPIVEFYAACSTFSVMLLCGYGARVLSYMAEQSNTLKRMAATLETIQQAPHAVDPAQRTA